jgi:Recombinase
VIQLIRRHHKSGKSLQQIGNWLNQHHYCTKRGQDWKRISVKRVLDPLHAKRPRACGVSDAPSLMQSLKTSHSSENTVEDDEASTWV